MKTSLSSDENSQLAAFIEHIIQPESKIRWPNLQELWAYRELLCFFALRDIKLRYKQTSFGVLWVLLQPLSMVLLFSVFFRKLAPLDTMGIPYVMFALIGTVLWLFFANSLSWAANSLTSSSNLISKVYFPRLVLPLSSVLAMGVDLLLCIALLLCVMPFFGLYPTMRVLLWPVLVLLLMTVTMAMGVWLAALNVMYRDMRFVVPFLIQLWFFATPVAYSSATLGYPWAIAYAFNPMVGIIEGFRWTIFPALGISAFPLLAVGLSSCLSIPLLITGMIYLRSVEKHFADRV